MITRCPSCQTYFRVHAEQLAARGGQVRCGRCARIFDALEYLIEETGAPHEPGSAHEPAAAATRADQIAAPEAPAEQAAELATAPEVSGAQGVASVVESAPLAGATEWTATTEPVIEPAPSPEAMFAPGATRFDFGPEAAAEPAQRARRWPWVLGALLLLMLLLAQAAYYFRSAIIVLFPAVKPYASVLCTKLGCDLPLPRRVELMSIEASDLQADTNNPNIMVLTATLKNRALFEQQLPLLELTLTDAQDQPVVRRVLAPQDYLGKGAGARSGFAGNSEIALKVYIESSQVKATGYRLYLFYP